MIDLVEWLRAQLDEDERIARSVHGPVDGPLGKKWWTPEEIKTRLCDDQIHMSDAQHIAAWDPARVLLEIDAKRRLASRVHKRRRAPDWDEPGVIGFECMQCCDGPWPCQTLRLIALPYAGREGYRLEWAPTD